MKLGTTTIEISKQGLGCMSMSEFYGQPLAEEEAIQLIQEAYKNGVNFFDTADCYACGDNEILLGKAIDSLLTLGASRESIVVATKGGIIRDKHDATKRGVDNSYSYMKLACEASLARLGEAVGVIDLYYIHRIEDEGLNIEEAMRAMADLLSENKIRSVGLSEASVEIIEKANVALLHYTNGTHQLAAVQSEYSLMTRIVDENGVLATCRKLGITFIAYSPLSRALLTGSVEDSEQFSADDFRRTLPRFQPENIAFNKRIVACVKALAEQKQCSTAQIALAWIMSQPGVVPIPGTTKKLNLLNNIAAMSVTLSPSEIQSLNALEQAQGYRYTEAAMRVYGFHGELAKRGSDEACSSNTEVLGVPQTYGK